MNELFDWSFQVGEEQSNPLHWFAPSFDMPLTAPSPYFGVMDFTQYEGQGIVSIIGTPVSPDLPTSIWQTNTSGAYYNPNEGPAITSGASSTGFIFAPIPWEMPGSIANLKFRNLIYSGSTPVLFHGGINDVSGVQTTAFKVYIYRNTAFPPNEMRLQEYYFMRGTLNVASLPEVYPRSEHLQLALREGVDITATVVASGENIVYAPASFAGQASGFTILGSINGGQRIDEFYVEKMV